MVINQAGNKSFMSYISISMTTIMAKFIVFKFTMATSNILIFYPPP